MSDCTKCPLHLNATTVKVPSKGSDDPLILFVGIAPSYPEDKNGQCFSGAPGKKLKQMIRAAKIDQADVRFTNLVRCIPWRNTKTKDKAREPAEDEIIKCAPYLIEEIAECRPKIIVPLGKIPTYFFLPHLGPKLRITKYSGTAFTWEHPETKEEYTVIPTLNPAAVCRNDKWLPDVIKALASVKEASTGKSVDIFDDCEYMYLDNEDKIEQYIDMVLEKYHANPNDPYNVVSVDAETAFADPLPEDCPYSQKAIALSPYNPYNTLVSVQISHSARQGALIPLWHKDSPLRSYNDIKMVAYHLQRLLDVVPAIGQNYKFDFQVLYVMLGVTTKKFVFDSMLAHFLVYQKTLPLALEELAGLYVDMPLFKQEMHKALESLPADKKHMGYVDLEKLLRYGCGDADVVFRLYEYWRPLLEENGLWETYETILSDSTAALGWIEIAGMVIDPERLEKLRVEYTIELDKTLQDIRGSWFIEEYNELVREQHDRKVGLEKAKKAEDRELAGKSPLKPRKWTQAVLDKREEKLKEKLAFNPGSSDNLRKLFFHWKLMGFTATSKTKTKRDSADKKAREDMVENAYKELDALKHKGATEDELGWFLDAIDLVELISAWTTKNKLFSSYIKSAPKLIHDTTEIKRVWPIELPPEVHPWSYHASFKIHGTDTGRLSCNGPNLQQMPATSAIKWMFVSRFADIGGCLLEADYSQAELRVLAIIAGETAMLEAFARGEDIHMFVAKLVFGALGHTVITKEMRRIAKRASFGIVYGQGPTALAYGFGTTIKEAKAIIATIYSVFPNLRDWMDSKEIECRAEGYVTSPMGRIRWIDNANHANIWKQREANRKAVNTPIQSAASDWTLCSLNEVAKRFRSEGLKSLLVATIHDSIMADVYPGELLTVIQIMEEEMVTNLPLRFDWMEGMEPKVDFEFGVDWKSMTSIEPGKGYTYKVKGKIENVKQNVMRLVEGGAELEQLDVQIDEENPEDSWALIELEMEKEHVSI